MPALRGAFPIAARRMEGAFFGESGGRKQNSAETAGCGVGPEKSKN